MGNRAKLVGIALALLIIGVVLPFLMIIKLVPSTFFLNLLAAMSSIAGLTVGFMAVMRYYRSHR